MTRAQARLPPIPFDANGRPHLPLEPEALYAFGHLVRETERTLLDLFGRGLLSGTTHTCIGQEFCQMAVVRALSHPEDAVLSTHRNHGHFLTYSGDVIGLLAEVMGREAGVCGGRGGSQHLIHRHFHSNGVQGGMTAIGVGLAEARRRSGSRAIVAAIIGDGTLGEGLLYESMNLASVWSAPVLFVVEANGVAQTTETAATVAGDMLARGAAFGLRTWRVSDDDPDLWRTAEAAVAAVREGRPGFLVIDTRRLGPHSKGDDLRPPEEIAAIRNRDPLTRLGASLAPERREAIEAANAAFLGEAVRIATASPEARFAAVPGSAFDGEGPGEPLPPAPHGENAPGNVRLSINRTLRQLLREEAGVLLIGEDLHDPYGGAFKVTAGLSTEFPGRVVSTPISEAAITGAGVGLALSGMRPVVEVMFADFAALCLDQLYNHAVKFPGVAPEARVPLVLRTPAGGRRGYGPTHSQSPENLLAAVPGLTLVASSPRHDSGRLLAHLVRRWDHPAVFLEHKLLYAEAQDPKGYVELPAHAADAGSALFPTLRRGAGAADLVILAYGGMVPVAEAAATRLEEEEEIEVALLVPALLSPLPRHGLVAALRQAPRILIAEEAVGEFGIGAEIMACLAEAGFAGRIARCAAPPVPIPSARSLEAEILPDEARIVQAALRLF